MHRTSRRSHPRTAVLALGALAVPLLLAGCSRDEAQVDTTNPTLAPGPGDGVVTGGSDPTGTGPAGTATGGGAGGGSATGSSGGKTSTSRSGSGSGSPTTTSAGGTTSTTVRAGAGGTSTTKAGGGAIDSGNFPAGGLPTTTAGAGDGFLVGQVVDCGTTAGVCTPMSVPAVNAMVGSANGSFAAAAPTDSAGNFHFALPPGDYVVVYFGGGGTCETRNGDDSPRAVHVSAGATASAGQVVCLPYSGRP